MSSPSFEESLPIDDLALAAYYACIEGVDVTQVNKLLEVLESTKDIKTLLLFLVRQVGRGSWKGRISANHLFQVLRKIESSNEPIDNARKALGLFKWLYEAGGKRRLPRLDRRELEKHGFFYRYLERCLSR